MIAISTTAWPDWPCAVVRRLLITGCIYLGSGGGMRKAPIGTRTRVLEVKRGLGTGELLRYHVVTDWDAFRHDLSQVPAIWNGGLSIFGAVLGGMLGVWIGCRRVKLPFWQVADCIAPGLVLAQALGRWGNYFNQELYGKPTNRPWGVEIDPQHRVAPYQNNTTFQPMFLFESILDVVVFLCLLGFTRKYWRRVPAGTVFALYVVLYDLYRVPLETFKIDPADIVLGQR